MCPASRCSPDRHIRVDVNAVSRHVTAKLLVCGCQPYAEEGLELLKKAGGQGHAYAMYAVGCVYALRKESKQAAGRGLHSFTLQLNVSAFCGIGGAFRRCSGGV